MSILRVIGACFWVGCGWFGGDFFCVRAQERLEELDKTLQLLRRLEQEISCRRTDLNMLYQTLFREKLLFGSCDLKGNFRELNAPLSFSEVEVECFRECFSGLGRTEAAQECARLRLYLQRFEQFRAEAEQTVQTNRMLSHRLGLGAGLAAAIFFL